jgi:hypothetical protein
MTSESAPAGQFHWTTRCLELAAVAPEPKLRQRFLRMARSFQVDVALLANSRATIAESRRLLATVEHSASGIQGYKARHREATMVPTRQIALDVAELGAETGLDSAALSVRVFRKARSLTGRFAIRTSTYWGGERPTLNSRPGPMHSAPE